MNVELQQMNQLLNPNHQAQAVQDDIGVVIQEDEVEMEDDEESEAENEDEEEEPEEIEPYVSENEEGGNN
jgi:hypothetical protein